MSVDFWPRLTKETDKTGVSEASVALALFVFPSLRLLHYNFFEIFWTGGILLSSKNNHHPTGCYYCTVYGAVWRVKCMMPCLQKCFIFTEPTAVFANLIAPGSMMVGWKSRGASSYFLVRIFLLFFGMKYCDRQRKCEIFNHVFSGRVPNSRSETGHVHKTWLKRAGTLGS